MAIDTALASAFQMIADSRNWTHGPQRWYISDLSGTWLRSRLGRYDLARVAMSGKPGSNFST
jgi:hypothetical protein